jgi:23S rRNA pseudouridine1911/1915/1917 synthase
MVVAKNADAHRGLSSAFKKRLTEKEYLAIAVGSIGDDLFMDGPIGRHPVQGRKMMSAAATRGAPRPTFASWLAPRSTCSCAPNRTPGVPTRFGCIWRIWGAPILGDGVYGRAST